MSNNILIQFLSWLATAAGSGVAVFAAIEFIDKLWPAGKAPLAGDTKFYLSIILAFLFPLLALLGLVALGAQQVAPDAIFAAVAAGWIVSQAIHRKSEAGDAGKPGQMELK